MSLSPRKRGEKGTSLNPSEGENKMSENNNNNEVEELDINHLMQIRRDKLKELQDEGKENICAVPT